MASAVQAAPATPGTPSPPPRVHTPHTPKFGAFGDNWEPYSPRKSARLANRTPSPQSSTTLNARTTTRHKTVTFTVSTPGGSPQQKKRAPAMDSVRRASGATLTAEGAAHAAASLGIDAKSQQRLAPTSAAMLPTPSKTPRKLPDDKFEAGVEAIARNLFPSAGASSEAVSSPRKKKASKKYTGISLESFRAEDANEDIAIYTDTRDRIPEVDHSPANPFVTSGPADRESPRRRSARIKKVKIPGEGRVAVNDAVQRDDGAVYVFRGKTFWKAHDENSGEDLELEDEAVTEFSQPRRSTRSSIKPRLLFPPKKAVQSHSTDDEEAATDIEEHVIAASTAADSRIETPTEKSTPDTPSAPRFAPASPPTTGRRASKRLAPVEETPAKRPTKARSPFDTWRRSKSGSKPQGQKREAEAALPGEGSSKRQRA